jgi:hypothetical protein
MATVAGTAIVMEIPSRTAKEARQALCTTLANERFTLALIAKSPLVRVTLTHIGPTRRSREVLTNSAAALKSEVISLLNIGAERLEWKFEHQAGEDYSARLRIEARELVIVRQEVR